jgi:hypothetical protein
MATHCLVRPIVVIAVAEGMEGSLLRQEVGARGANGFGLQRLVHPLVGAVLLGMGGENALVLLNAESPPPDIEEAGVTSTAERGGVPKSCPFQAHSGLFRPTPAHDGTAGSPLHGKLLRALPRRRHQA